MQDRHRRDGPPFPLDVTVVPADETYNFFLRSTHAALAELRLCAPKSLRTAELTCEFDPLFGMSGPIWHCWIRHIDCSQCTESTTDHQETVRCRMYWLPRKKVLVPTDFSEASTDAIHTALAMVEFGRCVHALHVVESSLAEPVAEQLPLDARPEELEATRREACQQRLATFLTDYAFDGLCGAVCTGDPAVSITRYAKENDIDLIVMAAHGYGHGGRLSIGSVTKRVLQNADCPVLVLRPDGRVPRTTSQLGMRESNGISSAETPLNRIAVSQPQ